MQSTFKTLNHPSSVSDNVFDELDTTRCTSWQYELHQRSFLSFLTFDLSLIDRRFRSSKHQQEASRGEGASRRSRKEEKVRFRQTANRREEEVRIVGG